MYSLYVILLATCLYTQELIVPVENYEVKEGDWLSTIASDKSVGWETLYNINKDSLGTNPDLIHAGDVVKIPLGAYITNPPPEYPSYTLEFWVFLILFSIFIWVIYKKKLSTSSIKTQPVEVKVQGGPGVSYGPGAKTGISEVPIEDVNVVNFDKDKVKSSNVKGYKLKSKEDPSELAKKLRKLKK